MDDLQRLKDELEQWKKLCEEANRKKKLTNLEKIKADDKAEELDKEVAALQFKKKKLHEDLKEQQTSFQEELLHLQMKRSDLKEEEAELHKKVDENEKAFLKIQDTLLVNSQLPQKNINFRGAAASSEKRSENEPMDITCTCHIVSGHPYVLSAGQALLTFEDEEVAKSVIAKKKHIIDMESTRVTAEALEPRLSKSVKFEVNMNISRKKLKICNLPEDHCEEILKDKVELTFYKSNIGGAEIENVDYDKNNNTACVTYLQNGVAQGVRKDRHQFMVGGATYEVEVMPFVDIQLNKLQMFSAISSRSVLLTGIKNVDDKDEDDVQDIIQIHFQKRSNGGGEVERTLFSQNGKKIPIFEEDLK